MEKNSENCAEIEISPSSGSDMSMNDHNNISIISTPITYDEFFANYLIPNKPCIIRSQMNNWSCQEWVDNNEPNFNYLQQLFGHCSVPVSNCNTKYYNSQFKETMKMDDYLNYWKEYKSQDYPSSMRILYLKDWHCVKNFPKVSVYRVPQYFASDWLNEYYISHPELEDDYMFVYMGPKGSWTPLHSDVFSSYSWSANVVGKKRWLLFPPGEEDNLRNVYGHLTYDATSDELYDKSLYKRYDPKNVKHLDIIQESGEMIFVPSGWYHQVWNLEDTISINHNWINACNIANVWSLLKNELLKVTKEIQDCREMDNWSEHCQLILKTSYGIDYPQFYSFLSFIAQQRLNFILNKSQVLTFKNYRLGFNHCIFDLRALIKVLKDFIHDSQEQSIYDLVCKNDEAQTLLNLIESVIE